MKQKIARPEREERVGEAWKEGSRVVFSDANLHGGVVFSFETVFHMDHETSHLFPQRRYRTSHLGQIHLLNDIAICTFVDSLLRCQSSRKSSFSLYRLNNWRQSWPFWKHPWPGEPCFCLGGTREPISCTPSSSHRQLLTWTPPECRSSLSLQ